MRDTDRRTARDRVKALTAGLAVGGTLGVAGVAGGLAVHAQQAAADPRTTQTQDSSSGSTSSSGSSATQGSVSSGSGQAQAQSSGS
jgi:hypothetical protein